MLFVVKNVCSYNKEKALMRNGKKTEVRSKTP